MSKAPSSFFDRLLRKEKPIKDELKTLGLDVLADQKLELRIKEYEEIYKMFQAPVTGNYRARLAEWRRRMQELDLKMQVVAVPYGRAGTSQAYAQMMSGWRDLYAHSSLIMGNVSEMVDEGTAVDRPFTEVMQEIKGDYKDDEFRALTALLKKSKSFAKVLPFLDKTVVDKEELVSALEHYLVENPVKYGFKIMAVSFSREDVSPAYATVVHTIQQSKGFEQRSSGIDFDKLKAQDASKGEGA